ncbi:MAG TPA: universal stress protein [Ktedonobacterales bacterium]|jgi:nucleotide-binding universal stress UspA family protein
MFKKILVPLDNSALAAAALLPASALARQDDAELMLVGATSTSHVAEIGAYLAEMVRCLSAEGFPVRAMLPLGSPENGSNEEGELARADLIVMTTHGRDGIDALIHPSVTWRVLAQTSAPILFSRYTDEEQAAPPMHQLRFMADADAPILVPLDGSPQAERVLSLAQEIAQEFGNPLMLARVGEPLLLAESAGQQDLMPGGSVGWWLEDAEAYLREKWKELTSTGLRVKTITALGLPSEVIQRIAQEYQAGLIVMASRGRGWLGRFVMGSVARRVLSQSEIPVLLARRLAPGEDVRTEQVLVAAGASR